MNWIFFKKIIPNETSYVICAKKFRFKLICEEQSPTSKIIVIDVYIERAREIIVIGILKEPGHQW